MKEYQKYLEMANKLGVVEARIIRAESVVTAEWVKLKCQFGCGLYGQKLTCPPAHPHRKLQKECLLISVAVSSSMGINTPDCTADYFGLILIE